MRAKLEQEHEVLRVQILVLLWSEDKTHDKFAGGASKIGDHDVCWQGANEQATRFSTTLSLTNAKPPFRGSFRYGKI